MNYIELPKKLQIILIIFLDYTGTIVSPNTPREEKGTYWGYTTRLAKDISSVFSESPYEV